MLIDLSKKNRRPIFLASRFQVCYNTANKANGELVINVKAKKAVVKAAKSILNTEDPLLAIICMRAFLFGTVCIHRNVVIGFFFVL